MYSFEAADTEMHGMVLLYTALYHIHHETEPWSNHQGRRVYSGQLAAMPQTALCTWMWKN